MSTPSLGQPTDLPCPVCEVPLLVRPLGRAEALVWCDRCGWNVLGSAKHLRGANLGHFLRTCYLLPFTVPLVLMFHSLDPVLAYGLDLLLVLALFVPALVLSQRGLTMARALEARSFPDRAPRPPEAAPPELATPTPRPVALRGSAAPLETQLLALRALWLAFLVSGGLGLTPLAHWVGPRAQVMALMLLAATVPLLLVVGGWLLLVLGRHRELVRTGLPGTGTVLAATTHMRRERAGQWALVARYRYRFLDPHGTEREGEAREVGRAIAPGMPVPVLMSPRDPRRHLSYLGALYRVSA